MTTERVFERSLMQQRQLSRVMFLGIRPGPVPAIQSEENRQRDQGRAHARFTAGAAHQIRQVSRRDEPGQQRPAFAPVDSDQGSAPAASSVRASP